MTNRLAAALALALLPGVAVAQSLPTVNLHPEYQSMSPAGVANGYVSSTVILCPDATGGDVAQVCNFGSGGSSGTSGTVTSRLACSTTEHRHAHTCALAAVKPKP